MTDSLAFKGRKHRRPAQTRSDFSPPIVTSPTITTVSPQRDTIIGGATIAVTGSNFIPGMTVLVGNVTPPAVTYQSPTTLTFTAPPNFVYGQVALVLQRPDNGAAVQGTFIYEDPEMLNGLRLSAQTGSPVPTGDVTSTSTLYLTPYLHGRIALWNGTYWQVITTSEVSLSLSSLSAGRLYDVYAYSTMGGTVVALELGSVWANDTGRSDSLTRLDGVIVKTADNTRRYIGTIKTITATATTDTVAQRFVWNMYNQVERDLYWIETTDSWTYTSTTIRGRGGLATARVEFVLGQPQLFQAEVALDGQGTTSAGNACIAGIGMDTTASFAAGSACVSSFADSGESGFGASQYLRATYSGMQTVGYHAAYWCERVATGSQTITMYGDHGATAGFGIGSALRGKLNT